jgi:pimeloyl-ACP methyl ester carboxylesterase
VKKVAGFDLFEVQFTKDGGIHNSAEADALIDHISSHDVTDLITFAHGWNNDMDDARSFYEHLLGALRTVMDSSSEPSLAARRFAVLGALWPSKKFAEEELIAGGGASVRGSPDDSDLIAQLEDLKGTFDDPDSDRHLEEAKALVPRLEEDEAAQKQFADLIRSSLRQDDANEEDASDDFFALPGQEVMSRLAIPDLPSGQGPVAGGGGAASMGTAMDDTNAGPSGGAAGLSDFLSNMKTSARNLLNFATYYQMKARAGTVGSRGVYEVLRRVRGARPDIRLHLIGHSFGGRLVTAAATGPPNDPALKIDSLALLQAAFSHYGFAEDWDGSNDGLFRSMVTNKMVKGPAIITHTDNDRAVGLAYPLASRIARQVAAGLGDESDRYGGIGRNGAQKTPGVVAAKLLASGGTYSFNPGHMYNLRADDFIGGHSDVTGREVAYALVSAIAVT